MCDPIFIDTHQNDFTAKKCILERGKKRKKNTDFDTTV